MTARRRTGPGRGGHGRDQRGAVALEWVLTLPLLALAVAGLLEVGGVVRDGLLVHEGARAGARAAATSLERAPVEEAVAGAVGHLAPDVKVVPTPRRAGDVVEVTVRVERSLGPVTHPLTARAVARVEPAAGHRAGP